MSEAELQQRVKDLEFENSELKKVLKLVKDNVNDLYMLVAGLV